MEDAIASLDQLNYTPQDQPDLRDLDVLAHLHTVEHPRVSQRSIANALGMSLGLTNAILRRTISHVVRYKEHLRTFCRSQHDAGIREIILVGPSDLTFILEWCADKEGLSFQHIMDIEADASVTPQPQENQVRPDRQATIIVLSEDIPESEVPGAVLLHHVVLGLS